VLRSKTIPLIAVSALLVTACGGDDDGDDKVAVGDYASDICTAFTDWSGSIRDRQGELEQGLDPDATPQEGKDALETFLDDAVDASDTLVEDVEAAGTPDTENGEDVAEALQSAAEDARGKLEQAREDLDDLPTDSPEAFSTAADDFGDEVRTALEGVGDGIEEIDTPELDKAIDEESACQG
jgi:predicted RNase H-like HicB family nuclease